ncbi:NAD-dependent epimerase/dehydratase family protein [Enterococcus dispar]|uniref:NAD-dependent epimerase/dehydratase family protein n=1 Tax=Enterococcus dispar TaxID=44009 RepID=UPI0021D408EB|nr:NAD-dependent epimerase/dehydratase family protein [Enterococcus dispar]MCU7357822.1 NAD-dependent epimerase/dehydratase family protein [Enterococcus dispar]
MKRILITGKNSYLGTSFIKYMMPYSKDYEICELDLKSKNWKENDFSRYDIIIHLAAIVHKKNINDNKYYEINRDLSVEVAKKAKRDGVSQFIFFSTMSVYGITDGVITRQTIPKPKNAYGKSKLEAENLLINLNSAKFKISILRPPMIYGPNAVGNYSKLSSFSKKIFFFPKIDNRRSMLFIDNLSIYVKKIIDNELSGIFFPQNEEYVNTSELVKLIAEVNNRKIILIPGFKNIIKVLSTFVPALCKIFGTLIYDNEIDNHIFIGDNSQVDFKKSILITEENLN